MRHTSYRTTVLIFAIISINFYIFHKISRPPSSTSQETQTDRLANIQNEHESEIKEWQIGPDNITQEKSLELREEEGKSISEPERTVVLLVSDFRSGSSFLGEMFNQNDDAYYIFEPLKGYHQDQTKNFLEKLVDCNPPRWGFVRRNRQSGCLYHEGWNGTKSKCLASKDNELECKKYGITVAKFIRLRQLAQIKEFGLLDRRNVFIVHSFRDPRGTINSRLMQSIVNYNGIATPQSDVTVETIEKMAKSLCERYLLDSMFGDTIIPDKYIRVRYEELCEDPVKAIRSAYGHIGHTPPDRVFEWFANHTQNGQASSLNDTMGLSRNSLLTSSQWKEELGREYICAVERNCGPLMDYFDLEYFCKN